MDIPVPILFLVLMLVGTFFLGYNDVQRKKYLNRGINDQVLLVVIQILGGGLLIPLLLIFGIPEIKQGFYAAFVGTIALNVISQNLFIRAFKLSDASLIAPLRLIIPPLVIVTGFLFLGEIPTWEAALGIVVTVFGLWFLLFPDYRISLKLDRGVVYGLVGCVLWALSFPLDKQTVVTSSALFATTTVAISVGVLTLIVNQIRNKSFATQMISALTADPKAFLSVSLTYTLGLAFRNEAFNYGLAAYASSLTRLSALWTVILSGKILQEKYVGKRLFATVLMFAGILLTVFLQ